MELHTLPPFPELPGDELMSSMEFSAFNIIPALVCGSAEMRNLGRTHPVSPRKDFELAS